MPDSGFVFSPAFRVATADLDAVAGGTIEFYLAGTNTATNVYSNSTLATSLGSTVYLDSGGHPVASSGSSTKVVVYTGAALIKMIVKDADGATLATYDNVRCAQDTSALSGGGSDGGVESVVSKTAAYTVLAADDGKLMHCDPTGGSFAITLPSAATVGDGFEIGVRHGGTTTTNTVQIASVLNQTIARGATTSQAVTVKRGGETLRLVSNAANWVAYGDTAPDFAESPIRIADRLTAPPSSPTAGARYIINGTPTLGWISYAEHDIMEADGSGNWIRYRPYADCGWIAYVQDENRHAAFVGTAWVDWSNITPPDTDDLHYIAVQYSVSNGTSGGAAAGSWGTRPINVISTNITDGTAPAIATNTITNVPAGKWLWALTANFYGTTHSQARISGATAGVLGYTTSAAVDAANAANEINCSGNGVFTLASSDTLSVQDIISGGGGANDRGIATSFSGQNEVYLTLTLIKLETLEGPQGEQGPQGTSSLQSPLAAVLANGNNNNVVITSGGTTYNRLRVTGPTGAFAITGLAAPSYDGHQMEIYCTVAQTMTFSNESASSTAANRILTMTGSDVALTGPSIGRLTYDTTDSRWHLVGTQG